MRKIFSLLLLLPLLTACSASAEQRTGEAEGYGGPLKVTVTLNGEDITAVKVIEHNETEGVGTRAIDALPALIAEKDSIDVDSVSGATVTSEAIKSAVSQALGMAGIIQDVIPLDDKNATEAASTPVMRGVGMASTGRVGPGKDSEGKQVYSLNIVFAAGQFEEDGTIRAMQVDQLELVTPNLGGGSAFSGFPADEKGEEAFLKEATTWQTKGAMGDAYQLTSGSWREQMDAYQQMMVGKTVAEVKNWYEDQNGAAETAAGDAAGTGGTADAGMTDAATSATMSLRGEYGDILLAIERSWEDARRHASGDDMPPENSADPEGDAAGTEGTAPEGSDALVDTNTVPDAGNGESEKG